MNVRKMCMHCMSDKLNEYGVCAVCGKKESEITSSQWHLPMRTILKGKYLIGKVIGEGGFGITYLGYDLDLEIRVAIKEFCPKKYAGRDAADGLTLYLYDESKAEVFESEKDKFINEARRLAKFRNEQGVVSVLDYFRENDTTYIVMDYIDGMTLKGYVKELKESGRFMGMDEIVNLFTPLMLTLKKLHAESMIHRDISPENIMISKDLEKVYLIDFGTARNTEDGETLSEYSKGFYTPIEQQSSKMKQGPWTDIYALCATIYVCITGRTLPKALDRREEDDLISPHEYGVEISASQEAALIKGLAVKPEDRIQSIDEFMQALSEGVIEEKTALPETVEEVAVQVTENVAEKATEKVVEKVVEPVVTNRNPQVTTTDESSDEPTQADSKKGIIKGLVKFVLIVVAICIGVNYYQNRTYREDYEDGTYGMVTLEDGSMVKCDRYSSTGRLLISATFNDVGEYTGADFYDDYGKLIETWKYNNGILTQITEYLEDGGTKLTQYTSENTYTSYERDSAGNLEVTNVIVNGELTESYLYNDWPKDGWWVHFKYEVGDNSNDNYALDAYSSDNILVQSVVMRNGERVEQNIINQELFDSVVWE